MFVFTSLSRGGKPDPAPAGEALSSASSAIMDDVTSSFAVVDNGRYVRVKRRRDEAPVDDFVMTRRAQRPPKKRKESEVLEGLQKLDISSSGGQFAATQEDSFGVVRRQKFKRVGTLSAAEAKNHTAAKEKLKKMLDEMNRPFRGKGVSEDIIPSYRKQSLFESRREVSQNAMRDKVTKLREKRGASSSSSREELIAALMEIFKQKEQKRHPTTNDLLFRAYCGNDMLPEDRRNLRKMYPDLHEQYKKRFGLSEEEALKEEEEEEEGDYVYDYYIRDGENMEDTLYDEYGASEDEEDTFSEDSNAENWYANDYPEEEDDVNDLDPFNARDSEDPSNMESDSEEEMGF